MHRCISRGGRAKLLEFCHYFNVVAMTTGVEAYVIFA